MPDEESLEQPDTRRVVDSVTLSGTAPEVGSDAGADPIEPMLMIMEERARLTFRLIQALKDLPAARQVEIVSGFMALDRLRKMVIFQEEKV